MTKDEQARHRQALINLYNAQLNELEDRISQGASDLTMEMLLFRRNILTDKLMKLYGTEAYGLVTA